MTFVGICFAFVNICKKKKKRKKKKTKKKKKEKRMKNGSCFFMQKSYMCMYMKKVEYSFAIFWFNAILGLDL